MLRSDPELDAVHQPRRDPFAGAAASPLVRRSNGIVETPDTEARDGGAVRRRSRIKRVLAYVAVTLAIVAAGFVYVAGRIATPLATTSGAPSWNVEVTTRGAEPITVIAYGREAGFHVVRVPADGSGDPARVIPARIADAELHLISLGWSGLKVRTMSPEGAPRVVLDASSRSVTIYQTPTQTGVRTGW
jgi:hypothetical protein